MHARLKDRLNRAFFQPKPPPAPKDNPDSLPFRVSVPFPFRDSEPSPPPAPKDYLVHSPSSKEKERSDPSVSGNSIKLFNR